MRTTGYLFKDTRDEERPVVLFVDGLEPDDDDADDTTTTLEVRFHSVWEIADVLKAMIEDDESSLFPLELYEPDHFEEVRE